VCLEALDPPAAKINLNLNCLPALRQAPGGDIFVLPCSLSQRIIIRRPPYWCVKNKTTCKITLVDKVFVMSALPSILPPWECQAYVLGTLAPPGPQRAGLCPRPLAYSHYFTVGCRQGGINEQRRGMTQTTEKMMWSGWKEDEELAETVTRSGHGLVRGGNEARRGRVNNYQCRGDE